MRTFLAVGWIAWAAALVSPNASRQPHRGHVRTVILPDDVYATIAQNARASAQPSERTAANTASAEAAENVVVSRIEALSSEMVNLKRENNRVSRKIIADAKEIHSYDNKTGTLLKANVALSRQMEKLQHDTEDSRKNLTNNWNKMAQLAQRRDEVQAEAAQEDVVYKAGKVHIQSEEEALKHNETAFEEQAERAQELRKAVQHDMTTYEEVNTKYKDRSAILKQIQSAQAQEDKLTNVVEFLKHENKSLVQDQQGDEEKIAMLRATLLAERQRRVQVVESAGKGAVAMRSLKQDGRKDKAEVLAKAVAAEETLAKQHTKVEELQEANSKLQEQIDARMVENSRLRATDRKIEIADHTESDRRAAHKAELNRLSAELRSEMRETSSTAEDSTDASAGVDF